jgi:hypothetical protein
MGLNVGKFSCSRPNSSYAFIPPNPDPSLYEIINQEVYGEYSVVEARYLGCTTFNGRKLMLLKTNKEIKPNKKLDPHLLGNGHVVIARFEPSEQGKKMARMCALHLTEVLDKE